MGNEFHNNGSNYGIQSIGNKNKNIVDNRRGTEQSELLQLLSELKKAVISSSYLNDETKEEQTDIIKDIEIEVGKPNPNKTKLQSLSNAVMGALQAIPDVAQAVSAVISVLAQFHI